MIYVDSNVFILSFLGQDESARLSRAILSKIARNEVVAFTSLLTWDEICWNARKYLGIEDAIQQSKKFLEFPHLNLIDVNELVIKTAQDLVQRYRLKPRDAIHAASALCKGIKLFLSEDEDFDAVKELGRKSVQTF